MIIAGPKFYANKNKHKNHVIFRASKRISRLVFDDLAYRTDICLYMGRRTFHADVMPYINAAMRSEVGSGSGKTTGTALFFCREAMIYYTLRMEAQRMNAKSGFTLVEILVVVVILGILGAIVIPQFKPAATEAKMSRVCSDLQVMRAQIGLYKIQHNDDLPGTVAGVDFQQAMTEATDQDGTLNAAGRYGPYVPKIPTNPFNELDSIEMAVRTAGITTPERARYRLIRTGIRISNRPR